MPTCGIRSFVILILFAAVSVHCEKLTDEEITNLFHTTGDNVLEHEIVPISYSVGISSDPNLQLEFTAFGKVIHAYLEPSNGQLAGRNTPVWLAFTNSKGKIKYKKMRNDIVGLAVSFFISHHNFSTIVMNKAVGKDKPSFQGMVDNIVIRPLPKPLRNAERFKRQIDALNGNSSLQYTHHHLVIKSKSLQEEQQLRQLEKQIRETTQSTRKSDVSKVKRSSKDVIYPSLLIRTDFKGSKTTKNDLEYYDDIMYQLAFWNGVDLRYRHVDNPKVRFRIAGMIFGQDRAATPYIDKYRYNNVINLTEAWHNMINFWKETSAHAADFPSKAYDIIITMTNYDLITVEKDRSITSILGMAANRALCLHGRSSSFYAVAVVKDMGGFDGILTATHEIGHIMSLGHDKSSGDECDQAFGFIMSPVSIKTLRNLEWSSCSLKSLSHFLRGPRIKCADQPAEVHPPGPPVPRFLPGDVVDTHKQCQSLGYAWACDPSPEMCKRLKCYRTGWDAFAHGWWCKNAGVAAEGTMCSPGHKCIDGICQCIKEDCIFDKNQSAV